MLESIQRLFFRHNPVFNAFKLITKCLNNFNDALMVLASPEDTTESASERELPLAKYHRPNILGIIKTPLWIAVSIALALLIGKLN